jgi:hypothetical protein
MVVLTAALLLTTATVARVVVAGARARGVEWSTRPSGVGFMPTLVAVGTIISLMIPGLMDTSASAPAPAPAPSPTARRMAPVYPGPPNDDALPPLNLPITFDYGPGPRHPVPSPASAGAGTAWSPREGGVRE